MSARDLLRTFIVKTNPYWPLSRCNRMPYALAIRLLVRAFRTRPEIRGIYLRHGLALAQWIPAMSDIDLSILIRRGLTAEQEYDFLESFWKTYDRLKRFFPMLGELEILNEDEFPTWLSYTSCTPGSRSWVPLHGQRRADLAAEGSPRWRQRALSEALWIYMDVLPPCFAIPDSFLRRQDIERRVRKILRLLKPVLSEGGRDFGAVEASGIADAVLALEKAVVYLVSIAPHDDADRGWMQDDMSGCEFSPAGLPAPAWLPTLEGVRSVIRMRTGKVLIIAGDGLDREVLDRITEASHQQWPGREDAPVVLPRSVFAYLIRVNNPYYYYGLLSKRIIAFGPDALAKVEPPGRGAFAAYTVGRIAHALTFARGETVFSRSGPLSLADCESALDRAMALRLLLRDDWISPRPPEIAARWRSQFPECAAAFGDIKLHVAEGRDKTAREAFFHLFRPIVRDNLARIVSVECARPVVAGGPFDKP